MNNKTQYDSDETVELPPDTLAILNEFLQSRIEKKSDDFEEDWQLSQFWYNESTKQILSNICSKLVMKYEVKSVESTVNIALLSCPSIYKTVKESVKASNVKIRLFEFDRRFSAFDDFTFYDYKDTRENEKTILKQFQNYFDIIIADPPFLSEECIFHIADIINRMKKNSSHIVVCSGQRAADWIRDALKLHQCEFIPEHEKNLANEFCSYANFDLDSMI